MMRKISQQSCINNYNFVKIVISTFALLLLLFNEKLEVHAQIIVKSPIELGNYNSEDMVRNILMSGGVNVSNVIYNGSSDVIECNAIGGFETGLNPTNLGIEKGLIISTGDIIGVLPGYEEYPLQECLYYYDESLAEIVGNSSINDVSVLEFDFVPWADTVTFNYVFASNEYEEYVNTEYNDVFGFFITGQNPAGGSYQNYNVALLPGTDIPMTINNINHLLNTEYYINNANHASIGYDGFTVKMKVTVALVPFTTYHFRFSICDVSDNLLDSAVFLEADSFTSNFTQLISINDIPYPDIPEGQKYCADEDIVFSTIADCQYLYSKWYFGDGTSATGDTVTHHYQTPGTYEVMNVIYDPHRTQDSLYYVGNVEVYQNSTFIVDTICLGFDYNENGFNILQPSIGTSTHTIIIPNDQSCDSIVTLELTVNNAINANIYDTICFGNGYYLYGFEIDPLLFEPGSDYCDTLSCQTIYGCDSIVTLHLTINDIFNEEQTQESCGAYVWNDTTYTATGDYEQTFESILGCDSIVTLHLTVHPMDTTSLFVTTCDEYEWYGNTYYEAGTYEHLLQSAAGCDSLLVLDLSFGESFTMEYSESACNSYSWRGNTYFESGIYQDTVPSPDGCDSLFVLNLDLGFDMIIDTSATACSAFVWNGMEYTATGDYEQTFESVQGCDSIVTLHLTINDVLTSEWEHQACNSFEWNGTEYTATGDYEQTFESVQGCDSIVTLHLTINDVLTSEWEHLACNSFVWNGMEYTATGDYEQTFESVQGCDSIVTLHLTINDVLTSEWEHQACNSFEWNGMEYTATGDYTQTFESVQGCDSIVTLHLTINDVLTSEWEHQACNSFVWNGMEYTATGDYEQTFESVQGCDSIVTLHLTINDVLTSEWEHQACNSFVWNGTEYTATGDYKQTFESIQGCDSIVTLHLTINDVLTSEWEHQACNSYEWNGMEYTATGDYEQTFQSILGCDSIVTLHFELVNAYEVYLDTVHCGAYWFDGHEIETSGYYEGQFVSSDGCDSTVYLQLTVERFPDTPIMEGQENVFVATDLVTGVYHYEAEPVPNATHYEWLLTGADWLMDTIGTSCTLTVIYPGTGILTLRAWNECGFAEMQKVINAGFFDVGEQEAVMVNVYPNPAKNKAVVESEGIMRIRMYSMKGQLLLEINGNGDDRVEVNLRDFAPAPYLFEVMTRNGVANVKVNVVR